jgi:hypothetical protein
VGTYEAVAKDVDHLKNNMLSTVKSVAGSLQSHVDWYWSRAAKGGTAVPTAIATHATAIYTMMDAKESAIAALTTLDEVSYMGGTRLPNFTLFKNYPITPHTLFKLNKIGRYPLFFDFNINQNLFMSKQQR